MCFESYLNNQENYMNKDKKEKFPLFTTNRQTLPMLAQQLVGMRVELRNVESGVMALTPLMHDAKYKNAFEKLRYECVKSAQMLEEAYYEVAPVAFADQALPDHTQLSLLPDDEGNED